MTAYVKFDPWACLKTGKEEKQNKPTFAGFATFMGVGVETRKSVSDRNTTTIESDSFSSTPDHRGWNKNQKQGYPPAKAAKVAKADAFPFAQVLVELEARCPDFIEPDRWQQCLLDARHFLLSWGDQAEALGWTTRELFGLHKPPANPHPSYCRLSRYDHTGLIWHLTGSRVIALATDTAAIQNPVTHNTLIYRKHHKPGLGPLGDSLDDFK